MLTNRTSPYLVCLENREPGVGSSCWSSKATTVRHPPRIVGLDASSVERDPRVTLADFDDPVVAAGGPSTEMGTSVNPRTYYQRIKLRIVRKAAAA